MIVGSNILAGASGQGGYFLNRSVRIRGSASAYFNRTPAVASNRQTWTWSGWVKRGVIGASAQTFFCNGSATGTNVVQLLFNSDALTLQVYDTNTIAQLITTAVYRDPAAWYHVVAVMNTTNATASNRMQLYVNGVQVTAFTTALYPTLNLNAFINTVSDHSIGNLLFGSRLNQFDGYVTEVNFIDGQALTPTSFGAFNPVTGVWQPIKYVGTYGTNGFYLNFNDNSAATAAAIGKDSSGNGNNWTPNNISVTAGATYDSMTDVPTLINATTANYCVLNPLDVSTTQLTLSDGNLTATQPSTGTSRVASSTFRVSTGKWYFETTTTVTSGTSGSIGIAESAAASTTYGIYRRGGSTAGLTGNPTFATYTSGDVIGVAFDVDARTISFYKNGTLQGTGGYTYTGTDSVGSRAVVDSSDSVGAWQHNFGQRPFSYTPPTGFKALNTYNLPTPTIANGANQFAATLWTGNATARSITNTVNGVSFQPDFVWFKSRSNGALWNVLEDSIRGATKELYSNATNAETIDTGGLTSFNANGFSLGTSNGGNQNAGTYVGWQWKASNATAVTNTAGSVTSQVSANPSAGFSIVTINSPGSGTFTFGHGLGVAPRMMIVKSRTTVTSWLVYHASATTTTSQYLVLNSTAATATVTNIWGTALPTSSVAGGLGNQWGLGTDNYVAYCFSEIAGYSKFGSYTGNGSADGTFVYLGFRPRFILFKPTSAGNWFIRDTSRDTYNTGTLSLYPNLPDAEFSGAALDILSNGFKPRSSGSGINGSGENIIYAAFAENPFSYSLAR